MLGDLTLGSVQILPELLPRILRSNLLSKQYSAKLRQETCFRAPSDEELWQVKRDNNDSRTLLVDGGLYINDTWVGDGSETLTCERMGGTFTFHLYLDIGAQDTSAAQIVAYPPEDYKQIYKKRRCDVERSITNLLNDLISRTQNVDESNISEILAWTVQLTTYDDVNLVEGGWTIEGFDNLRDELHRLCRYYLSVYARDEEESSRDEPLSR